MITPSRKPPSTCVLSPFNGGQRRAPFLPNTESSIHINIQTALERVEFRVNIARNLAHQAFYLIDGLLSPAFSDICVDLSPYTLVRYRNSKIVWRLSVKSFKFFLSLDLSYSILRILVPYHYGNWLKIGLIWGHSK